MRGPIVPGILRGVLGAALAAPIFAFAQPEAASGYQPKALAHAEQHMVSAAHPMAVAAGLSMLRAGGAAIDAAIAAQMVLNLVEPQSSGIGGGGFMLYFDKQAAPRSRLHAYDGRETAPAQADSALFEGADGKPLTFAQLIPGGRTVGVPGLLRMLELAHRAHGKLRWAELFEPAIKLAEDGFSISPRLYAQLRANPEMAKQKVAGDYFFMPADAQGQRAPKPIGTRLVNRDFADTLRVIAQHGAAAFYRAPIADDIVRAVREHPTNPGKLATSDLAGYAAKQREPICGRYRTRYEVCGMPMPSSGGLAVAMTLGILDRFDLAGAGLNSAQTVHLVAEAYRLVYADRARYMADADFVPVPVAGLLDANYLQSRARLIDLERAAPNHGPGTPAGAAGQASDDRSEEFASTTHLSIVDRFGNALAMTSSIEYSFGAQQMVRGFLLNNQLTDFSKVERTGAAAPAANRLEPGKRPRSAMAPTMIFNTDGELEMIIGSPGGPNIIQYVVKTIINVIDFKLDIQQAIDAANFGTFGPSGLVLERQSGLEALTDALQRKAHTVKAADLNSGLHGIVYNGLRGAAPASLAHPPYSTWAGGADPRREGLAHGR